MGPKAVCRAARPAARAKASDGSPFHGGHARLRKRNAARRMRSRCVNSALITMPSTVHRASRLPTGNGTFLFTDIEGSTMLWEQQPDCNAGGARAARHGATPRDQGVFRVSSSRPRATACIAVFGAATDALEACVAAQRCLASATSWSPEARVEHRLTSAVPLTLKGDGWGLHTGAAEFRDLDYFGPSLNRAARIMSAAHGEQVLLSATTAELVRGQLPKGVTLRELGEHRLKGVAESRTLAPGRSAGIARGFSAVGVAYRRSQLAGRARCLHRATGSLTELARRVDAGARLISVLGLGGTGKTRLVTRFGWRCSGGSRAASGFATCQRPAAWTASCLPFRRGSTCRSGRKIR